MPDYNLGRAHGTIRVDYDGRGVRQADEDLTHLGQTTENTGRKTTEAAKKSTTEYDQLAEAARKLETEVTRAAANEIISRAKAAAAQEKLIQLQHDSSSSAHRLAAAQEEVLHANERVHNAVSKSSTAQRALINVQRQLASAKRPDLTPNVDGNKLQSILGHLKNIDASTKRSSSFLNTFSSRLRLILGSIAVLSPAVSSLAVTLASLSGFVGIAAGALAALAVVGGTVFTAFAGLGQVFKTANQQAASAGQSAAQLATQQRSAAKQIQDAIRGVRNAEENLQQARVDAARAAVRASQQIVSAERAVRDAQFDAIRAQENLTRARREAVRQLEDLRSQLVGGALDERQAIIDVQRAQEELTKTLADPRSSDLDKQQAILILEKQKEALERVRRENVRLGEDQKDAAAKGVDGSNQVVDAQQDILHAQEAVANAQDDLAAAVVEAAQQQVDSQHSIRDATESVADAQSALAEAYLQAQEVGSGAAAKMADAMAHISPEARALATAILSQRDAWEQVKFAVQDALFASLSKEVQPLAQQWLPLLKQGMVGVATELHGVILEIIDFLKQADTARDVATIFDNTKQTVHNLIPGIRALLEIFFDLATVGSGFLPKMAQGFSDWATRLADVTQKSRDAGAMQSWMQTALDTLHKIWELLGNVASIIGTIFGAFNAEGGDTLTSLINLTQRLEDFLKSAQGQDALHALGKTLAALAKLIGDVVIGTLIALGPAFVAITPLIQQVADIMGKELLIGAKLLGPVLKIIADIFTFLSPVLAPFLATFLLLNKAVQIARAVWLALNATMAANPFILIIAAVVALAFLIVTHWTQIKEFLKKAWEEIKDFGEQIWLSIKAGIVDPIVEAKNQVVAAIGEVRDFFLDVWHSLEFGAEQIWNNIRDNIVTPVREAFDNVINFVKGLPERILEFFRDAGQWLFQAGRDLIMGFLNGIKDMALALVRQVTDIVGDVVHGVTSFLGIGSPSKLFRDLGEFTWQGYLVGINDMEDPVVTRMFEIATAVGNAGQTEQLVPTLAVMATPRVSTEGSGTTDGGEKTIVVQNLYLKVTGNLDPTDPVRWRGAMKKIRSGIENVDRSEKP